MPEGSEFQSDWAPTLKLREAKVVRTRGTDNILWWWWWLLLFWCILLNMCWIGGYMMISTFYLVVVLHI